MALHTRSRLLYPDANTTPWPFNHHAYVYACTERLAKEVRHQPLVRFSESQIQREDTRGALVRLEATEETPRLLLSWDERWGWSRFGDGGYRPLVLGGEPLLAPEIFAHAVSVLLAPQTQQLLLMSDGARRHAHPVDSFFERRLASYRMP